jgi:hypothetical protein
VIEFGVPLWLLGLLAIPCLRWLHRSGAPLRATTVASLEPWPQASLEATTGATRPPPDPAWRRRAAILALLLVALAAPRLPSGPPPLTVWIDDTPSLATIADGSSRLERGRARVESALAQRAQGRGEVEFRRFLHPPRPAALDPRREHWLLSDGSRAATAEWLREAPIGRVVMIEDAAVNVGLIRLAARASLREGGGVRVLLGVANGGNAAASRQLELAVDGRTRASRELALAPLAEAVVEFEVPDGATRLAARLVPGDALADDDRIELSLDGLAPLVLAVADDCPAELHTALEAHPALTLGEHGAADVQLACGPGPPAPAAGLPLLHFAVDGPAPAAPAPLQWTQAVREIATDPTALPTARLRGALQPRPGERVLANSEGAVALAWSAGPPRVLRSALDPARGALGNAEYARWLAWLIDTTVGTELLGRVVATERPDASSRVAAAARLPNRGGAAVVAPKPAALALARPLLAIAVLLLAWELALQLRRIRRDGRSASAAT